ncbi:hypothetical protein CH379_007110 [Leptospira ellisii]|uniref:SRPBCC family protein n=1 Tax=Leptospira ellisii TaxID=2023197 RepID=A0A2N0BAL9_9LEPT|nr:hypothetical protein [Leptospira ellisii]MDV6235394.1 hypothetical protein [Leptospira ellisii]PJZ93556.1 hypothetical protein CH379_07290 [Leptospira ellisii]
MKSENRISKAAKIATASVISSALLAFLISAPFWALNGEYGFVLFIAYPFSLGALSGFLISIFTKGVARTFGYVFKITLILTFVLILVFLVYAKEGLICVFMGLPIVYVLLFTGTLFGSVIFRAAFSKYLLLLTVLFFNVSAYLYDYGDREPDLHEVRTSVEIGASKKEIWDGLVAPFEFGEADNFFLRNGVSYPLSMKITEYNHKRILDCDYTNGSASAEIDSFVNGENISFSFPEPQITMKETSLYGEVEPKHIRGKIWAKSGEFRLVEISGSKTKLVAATKYVNNLGPKFYWELWENYLMDEMHLHVLNKVKEKLESKRHRSF